MTAPTPVIVVTGASSGIGRTTAEEFAARGAAVVLAARRAEALHEVAEECRRRGGQALAIPTDVTDEAAVKQLARAAVDTFGRIDVWVNNAGVIAYGRFEDTPADVFRRVLEVNLFGYVHGARAVLPYFRDQRTGTLINVDSILGFSPQPYGSPYVCSKFAVRGFTDALRMELGLERDHRIRVCSVLPATIDTNLFQHAANYSGRNVQPPPPVYPPEQVAAAIVRLAQAPEREVIVGPAGHAVVWSSLLAPALHEPLFARYVERTNFGPEPAPAFAGNLFAPVPDGTARTGGWLSGRRLALRRVTQGGLVLAASALLAWRAWSRGAAASRANGAGRTAAPWPARSARATAR